MPLVLQVLTFITISLLTGIYFSKIELNFFLGIAVGCSIQFIGNYIFISILSAYTALKNKKLENDRIKEFSYQGLEVECPCFKKVKEFVPIRLNSDNKYKCTECGKMVGVLVEATTAVTTEPIYSPEQLEETLVNIANKNANS